VIRALIPRNVPEGASLPGLNRKEMQTLTPEQVKRILKAVEGDRLEALYEVDTVDRGLNEPSATDDVPERRSDSPPPGGITPPDR
jgi:hypothetical protein